MKKKVKFFIPRVWMGDVYLPITQYVLQMSYDLTGKYPERLEWCPSYVNLSDIDIMWNEFLQDDPDIVCFSVYVWNAVALHTVAKRIREQFPNKTIILGGPDVSWKTPAEYWHEHPYYDYIIYGDAEEAFPRLIDLVLEQKESDLNLLQVPNLIFKSKDSVTKTPHKIYKGALYKEHSPWLYNKEDFERDCESIRKAGYKPTVAWESDRGCPYKCSFCDWQAGLHHKVIRKTYSFSDEFLLFAKNGCRLLTNTANMGFYEHDVEIMSELYRLSKEYPDFDPLQPCWAKLNSDRVYKMLLIQGQILGKIYAKQHLQSINETVLKNIDRPGNDWKDQKNTIIKLREESGVEVTYHAEFIVGLPGETKETWDHAMLEIIDLYPINNIDANHWVLLPNSPGAEPDYIEKYKLKIVPTMELFEDVHKRLTFDKNLTHDQIVELIMASNTSEPFTWKGNFVHETYSSTLEDRLYMLIASGVCLNLQKLTNGNKAASKIMYKKFRDAIWKRAQGDGARFRKYYEQYGVMPSYVWHDGILYMYREAWVSDQCFKILKI